MKDYTWDLSFLYKDFSDPALQKDINQVYALCKEARALDDMDLSDREKLCRAMKLEENITKLLMNVVDYVMLTLAADNNNKDALALQGETNRLVMEYELTSSALVRLVGKVADLESHLAEDEELGKIAFHLREMKQQAQHLLPNAAEDWMLRLDQDGAVAFSQLRDRLTGTLTAMVNGKELPLPAVRGMAYDADASVRKAAYEGELECYHKIESSMAYCLSCIKGSAITKCAARGYSDNLTQQLAESRVSPETLEAMWTAVRESLPNFRRYLRTKAKLLGHEDGLPFYDLFAPIGTANQSYTIEEAHELLVKVFTDINPDMGAFMDYAFENRWIDFFPREGKEGGAFCEGFFSKQSRVLTNFVGSFSDVSTIAHELGHGWHNRCLENMPVALQNVPMPLAETASIFNETLLSRKMLSEADEGTRLALLDHSLMESTQTVVDIYSRFLFESAVFEARKTHIPTVEELNGMMLTAQEESYGDGLSKDCRHPSMWVCKSHYYSPNLHFYNFPYCFGLLFGLGVYRRYKQEGASFLPVYNQLLSQCGNGSVADIAASVGIDVTKADYWRGALSEIREEIDEFCAIASKHEC